MSLILNFVYCFTVFIGIIGGLVLHVCQYVFRNHVKSRKIYVSATRSGVSRILFRGGFKIFLEKWGNLHGAKLHAACGEATRLLGGFGGMLPRENLKKWCNLVRFREYFAKILSKKYF